MIDLQKVKDALEYGRDDAHETTVFTMFCEALAELEKPCDGDLRKTAEKILNDCDGTWDTMRICSSYIQQYAESYHAEKCKEQWVSVMDRLQTKQDEYLCISMKDACPVHRPYVAVFDVMGNTWVKLNGITCVPSHWQPLPEAPK